MQITLPPDLEQFVAEKIEAGEYANPSEVITNALETFKVHEHLLPSGEELKRVIAEGQAAIDRGELRDGRQVFRELLARSAERRARRA